MVQSHFRAAEMLYKVRNDERALAQYEQAIVTYTNWPDEQVQSKSLGSLPNRSTSQGHGSTSTSFEIFGDLMEKPQLPALQQLSSEQHQALSRQLAYENYLND